jgi:plastocyanin
MRRLLLVLTAVASLAVAGLASAATTAPQVVHLSAPVSGLRYNQTTLHAHAGKIKIVFQNHSTIPHNVNVESGETELGKTAVVSKATTSVVVNLKAGKYNYYCSVPGHEDAGMHGTLFVS